jgi:hypothetical protein
MVVGSLIAAVPLGLLTLIGSRVAALALVVGVLCGLLNALVSMRSNERLIDHRSALIFVLSSVLRVFVFGILPVGFVLHGPWWALGTYFVGFFTPLALFAAAAARKPPHELT